MRSFGRTRSRTLKPRQAGLLETLLPRLAIPLEAGRPLDPSSLTPAPRAVWLEVGFGGGEHLAVQAARHGDVLHLGAEPFVNGVASLLQHVERGGLSNVRVHAGDVRPLLDALPDGSLERVFVLFPDPWPKARHVKRRLVNAETAAVFARLLRPGGRLRFATDWADYADKALLALTGAGLRWTAERAGDWRSPPDDHVATRYEAKRLGDIAPVWLDFVRD